MSANSSDLPGATAEVLAPEEAPSPNQLATLDWSRISPWAAVFFLGRLAKGVVGNLPTTLGTLATLVALGRESIWYAALGLVGVTVLLAAIAVARYLFFRYRIDAQGVQIRQGVFKRDELDLKFHRIQGVNVEQSLVYRWRGLATVSFDTAGSARQEGHLPAVTLQFADALRRQIDERRQAVSRTDEDQPMLPTPVLVQLDNADMLRIGLTDPTVLIVLAALPALFPYVDDDTWDSAQRTVDTATAELADLAPSLLAALAASALLVVLIVLLGATIASAFLRFHGYRLALEGSVFRARAGLLTRKEVVMDASKIQQLRLTQSLALRCFGRYRLRALPATSGEGDGSGDLATAQTLHVPILTPDAALDLRDRMLPNEGEGLCLLPRNERFVAISTRYIRARVMAVGMLPALPATLAAMPLVGPVALFGLAWIALVAIFAWQSWRRRAYMHDDQGLAYRSGLLGYNVDVLLFRKVQGATTVQSPMQRRHGLATLHIHLASGSVTVPFIDREAACRLRDYMLYKAESSRAPWH